MTTRAFNPRKTFGLTALLLAPVACTVGAGPAPAPGVEPTATTHEALFGNVTIDSSCSATNAALIRQAMAVGRTLVQTPEFKSCVAAQYRACSQDADSSVNDLIAATQSANAMTLTCSSQGANTWASTSTSDEYGFAYPGTETFTIATELLSQIASANPPAQTGNDFFWPTFLAGVIWHEAMHVHGWQHGDNSDPSDAADDCGYGSDPTWNWRANSGPYAVQYCLTGAYTAMGRYETNNGGQPDPGTFTSIVPSASTPPAPLGLPNCTGSNRAPQCSLVDLYMVNANRYPITSRRDVVDPTLRTTGAGG